MSKGLTLIILALPALLSSMACTGTDTGNPFTQPLTVHAHSSNPGEVTIVIADGGAVVTEAWISIDVVGLSEECGTPPETSVGSLDVADYAKSEALARPFEVQENRYCELQVPWGRAAAGGPAPAEADDTAIYLVGSSASGTKFVLRSALTGTVSVSAIGESFELREDLGGLFMGFDLAKWFRGVDLTDADVTGDTIVIDTTNNADLLTLFEANVADGIELYRDVNGNGQVDGVDDVVLARGGP
jgi:hypothetical protein